MDTPLPTETGFAPSFFPSATSDDVPPPAPTTDRRIAARWTERLAARFCPVSSYFLANYHRVMPHDGAYGLSSTEAMLLIHLMDYKWTKDAPYPTTNTLAKRMGISQRQVRATLQKLEGCGLLRRERPSASGANRYRLEPLFERLEQMLDEDEQRSAREAA